MRRLTSEQLSGNSPIPSEFSQELRTAVQNTKLEDWDRILIAIKKLQPMFVFDLCPDLGALDLQVAADFAIDLIRIVRLKRRAEMVLGYDSDSY